MFQRFYFGLGPVCSGRSSSHQQWKCFRHVSGEHPAVYQGYTCPLWGANPSAASGDKQEIQFQVHSWSKQNSWSNRIPTHLTLLLFLNYFQKAERVSSCSFFILRKTLLKEKQVPKVLFLLSCSEMITDTFPLNSQNDYSSSTTSCTWGMLGDMTSKSSTVFQHTLRSILF